MKAGSSLTGCVGVLGCLLFGLSSGCGSDGSQGSGMGGGGGAPSSGNGGGQNGGSGDMTAAGGSGNAGGESSGGSGNSGGGTSPGSGGGSGASGALGGGGTSGASGAPPGTGMGAGNVAFGLPCQRSSDCVAGLICLLSSGTEFDGGGVSNGLCSMDCSADLTAPVAGTTVCTNAAANAVCLQVSMTKAYCVESCTEGPPMAGQVKCHNRKDMACADPDGTGGFCQPTCRGDFDCQARKCDLASGVCVDTIDPARKLPDGSNCDPKAVPDPCHGACVGILEANGTTSGGFCSGFCKLGELGCGIDPNSTSPPSSFCLFGITDASDRGDLGFCGQLCDCNDDCKNPSFICSTVSGLAAQAGHTGICNPPNSGTGGASTGTSCTSKPDGG